MGWTDYAARVDEEKMSY